MEYNCFEFGSLKCSLASLIHNSSDICRIPHLNEKCERNLEINFPSKHKFNAPLERFIVTSRFLQRTNTTILQSCILHLRFVTSLIKLVLNCNFCLLIRRALLKFLKSLSFALVNKMIAKSATSRLVPDIFLRDA